MKMYDKAKTIEEIYLEAKKAGKEKLPVFVSYWDMVDYDWTEKPAVTVNFMEPYESGFRSIKFPERILLELDR